MRDSRWLSAGLFAATFATLLVEILDARLLSVLTWYHLSFLAVSLAMLGMAAGAIRVFLAADRYDGEAARARLPGLAMIFGATIVASHILTLCIPIPALNRFSVMEVAAIAAVTAVLAAPFYVSGLVVTVALTRTGGSIGRLYAWDLAGAAAACLAVAPLLDSGWFNVTSLVFVAAAAATGAGVCFAAYAGSPLRLPTALLTMALAGAAAINGSKLNGLEVAYPKNRQLWMATSTFEEARWNSHSYVILQRPVQEGPFYWGLGKQAPLTMTVRVAWLAIDGEAGTPITQWDGNPASIDWVRHDVTTLPYHLRRGSAAVIGVGGGRDILSAIWGRNDSIVGIDVNAMMIDTLQGRHRRFARIADHPGVELVHDDARAFLTRAGRRFDVIQMSLIDTWAATGAGAFTLSENGLYTVEGWKVFLTRLKPGGVLSVSRWFAPENVSETNRLLALAVASLQALGVPRPLECLLLVSRGRTATLLASLTPFTANDEAVIRRVASDEEFALQVTPWTGGATPPLDRIARSGTPAELRAATADPTFDYTPPTDERPFFFNMLKPGSFARVYDLPRGGVMWGNIRATATLVLLFAIATVLVAAIIVWPLAASGRPPMRPGAFAAALSYFAGIGLGFMLVQIALLQRFSIFLGHPAYSFSVTLFAMILFAGAGSYVSDLVAARRPGFERVLPFAAAGVIALVTATIGPVTEATIGASLPVRIVIVVAFIAPLAALLGCFFPAGMRAVAALSPHATAWMWGINGACGVLGSIVAVAISIWIGIRANLLVAAVLYAALLVPLRLLRASATEPARPVRAARSAASRTA